MLLSVFVFIFYLINAAKSRAEIGICKRTSSSSKQLEPINLVNNIPSSFTGESSSSIIFDVMFENDSSVYNGFYISKMAYFYPRSIKIGSQNVLTKGPTYSHFSDSFEISGVANIELDQDSSITTDSTYQNDLTDKFGRKYEAYKGKITLLPFAIYAEGSSFPPARERFP